MDFNEIWNIIDNSFEENLHRTYKEHLEIIESNKCKIITHEENGKCVGFLTYWTFEDFLYIEHFAVDKNLRGNGIGKKLLSEIMKKDGLKILEVELPETQTDIKRIKFYENFGFIKNSQQYYQPPYNKKFDKTPLIIMSTKLLNDIEFNKIKNTLYKNVYNTEF